MSDDTDKLKGTFDSRMQSYTSFFDHAWARTFLDVSNRSRLSDPAFVLTRDWKSTANAARTPSLIVPFIESFHEGITRNYPPFPEQLTAAFGAYVVRESQLPQPYRTKLIEVIEKLGRDVAEQIKKNSPAFDPQELWREMIQHSEFTLSLWSMQRMAYTGVYCAYENFIQRVVEVGRNDPNYRAMRLPELKDDFAALLGQNLADECIDHPAVRIVTLVRNCLGHDGGRESERLRAVKHGIEVVDGQIQLMPEHVRGLFDLLKGKALRVAEVAAGHPALKR